MAFENVGNVWDPPAFRAWLATQDLSWAKGVTIHHTASPSLAQRPQGFSIQHMRNLQNHYENILGWSAGPHLFIDDDEALGLSSIERRGIHAKSFNATHIGIEVLGDYDNEDPTNGRGLACWTTAAAIVGIILERTGWAMEAINFHRDDPRTSKTCPGTKVSRASLLNLIPDASDRTDEPDEPTPAAPAAPGQAAVTELRLQAIEWQVEQIRKDLS